MQILAVSKEFYLRSLLFSCFILEIVYLKIYVYFVSSPPLNRSEITSYDTSFTIRLFICPHVQGNTQLWKNDFSRLASQCCGLKYYLWHWHSHPGNSTSYPAPYWRGWDRSMTAQVYGGGSPSIHRGDMDEIFGFWLHPGPAPVIVAIWVVTQ